MGGKPNYGELSWDQALDINMSKALVATAVYQWLAPMSLSLRFILRYPGERARKTSPALTPGLGITAIWEKSYWEIQSEVFVWKMGTT